MAGFRCGNSGLASVLCAALGLGGSASAATVTVLHTFDEFLERTTPGIGAEPTSGVITDARGNLYGTTSYNGFG